MLGVTHLSDEAIAAFVDGALSAGARGRAASHLLRCPECAEAVGHQREAASVLRTAPLPVIPADLVQRLRSLPSTTPINQPVHGLSDDGRPVFPAFGAAALVADDTTSRSRRSSGLAFGAVTAAAAFGTLAVAFASGSSGDNSPPTVAGPSQTSPAPATTPLNAFVGGARTPFVPGH